MKSIFQGTEAAVVLRNRSVNDVIRNQSLSTTDNLRHTYDYPYAGGLAPPSYESTVRSPSCHSNINHVYAEIPDITRQGSQGYIAPNEILCPENITIRDQSNVSSYDHLRTFSIRQPSDNNTLAMHHENDSVKYDTAYITKQRKPSIEIGNQRRVSNQESNQRLASKKESSCDAIAALSYDYVSFPDSSDENVQESAM